MKKRDMFWKTAGTLIIIQKFIFNYKRIKYFLKSLNNRMK